MQAEIVRNGRIEHPVRIVVIDGAIVKIKRCQFCRFDLPVERFMVSHRRDGEACEWKPRCKTCDPPFRRVYANTHRARINQRARASYRRKRAEQRKPAHPGTHAGGGNLPREPFRDWLLAYAKREHLKNPTQVAASLGIVDRRIRSVMHREQPMVSLDTVDAALVAAKSNVVLNDVLIVTVDDLYPGSVPMLHGRHPV